MAVGNIKGFYVHDESNNQDGVAKLWTDAYADSSVTTAKLANGAVAEAKLATGAVTSGKIGNGAVGTAKLADEAVTSAKLADEAVTSAKLADDVVEILDHKADQDGDYDSLTAGGAKQLLSTVYVDDNEPYNFRTAGGSADIGDRMYDEVVGGTVVWNQLVKNGNFVNTDNWTKQGPSNSILTVENGVACLEVVSPTDPYTNQSMPYKIGHVYLNTLDLKTDGTRFGLYTFYNGTSAGTSAATVMTTWVTRTTIVKPTTSESGIFRLTGFSYGNNPVVAGSKCWFKNAMCIDLTAMFGSTIADYLLSLGADVALAWFKKLFPKSYYEYNAGALMSVKAGSHDTVGFNAWDEEWEVGTISDNGANSTSNTNIRSKNYIPVVQNSTYFIKCSVDGRICYYDNEKQCIGSNTGINNRTVTIPAGCQYVRFAVNSGYGATYKNDICIHLAWDGERNGEYEPYEKHTYPLSNIELRGIPKLDANNQLYYDGDTYTSDGTVTRKYALVDLGTVGWNKNTTYGFYSDAIAGAFNVSGYSYNAVCTRYPITDSNSIFSKTNDKVMACFGRGVVVRDTSYDESTAADFKSAMSGVYLVYELAEPTTETADAFTNPQIIDDFGTEEYTDYAVEAGDRDVAIPVGHDSKYMNNLRAKLEMAPDSPDGDGDYIVRQSNGENSYVPYTADGRLTALEAKLPAPPSANGTYKLTATVTDGGVTYTWTAG